MSLADGNEPLTFVVVRKRHKRGAKGIEPDAYLKNVNEIALGRDDEIETEVTVALSHEEQMVIAAAANMMATLGTEVEPYTSVGSLLEHIFSAGYEAGNRAKRKRLPHA